MTPKCPDCRRDQDECTCHESKSMQQIINRQAAQIEMLRETLLDLIKFELLDAGVQSSDELCFEFREAVKAYNQTTPDQALEQFAAKVRGQCAKGIQSCGLCGRDFANEIRAIKELP